MWVDSGQALRIVPVKRAFVECEESGGVDYAERSCGRQGPRTQAPTFQWEARFVVFAGGKLPR